MLLGWPPTTADKHAEQERQAAKDFHWCRRRHAWHSLQRILNEVEEEVTLCGPLAAEALQHVWPVSRESVGSGGKKGHILQADWLCGFWWWPTNWNAKSWVSSLAYALEIFHFHNWLLCKSKVYSWEKSIQIWTCRLKCSKCAGLVKSKDPGYPSFCWRP